VDRSGELGRPLFGSAWVARADPTGDEVDRLNPLRWP